MIFTFLGSTSKHFYKYFNSLDGKSEMFADGRTRRLPF